MEKEMVKYTIREYKFVVSKFDMKLWVYSKRKKYIDISQSANRKIFVLTFCIF